MKLKEEGTKVMFALIRLGKSCMHVLLRLASIETKGRKRRRRLRRRGSAVPGGRQMGRNPNFSQAPVERVSERGLVM